VIEPLSGLQITRANQPRTYSSATRRIAAGFGLGLLLPIAYLANAVPAQAEIRFVSTIEGDHFVYLPPQPAQRILLVAHGTPRKDEPAKINARRYLKRWLKLADRHSLIVISPVFDEARFGSRSQGYGGYRGLFGKHIGADTFIDRLVGKYARQTKSGNGRFLLYGHSAGGQFAVRYTVRYPDKVEKTVVSASGRYSYPTTKVAWPYGAGPFRRTISWDKGKVKNTETVEPRLENYAKAVPKIAIVIGAKDTKPQPERPGHVGRTRVELARSWASQMNRLAAKQKKPGRIKVTIAPGIGHDSRKLMPYAAKILLGD